MQSKLVRKGEQLTWLQDVVYSLNECYNVVCTVNKEASGDAVPLILFSVYLYNKQCTAASNTVRRKTDYFLLGFIMIFYHKSKEWLKKNHSEQWAATPGMRQLRLF
jgi:hypothetical protein